MAFRRLQNVGFPRLYIISGLSHAAYLLATPVLHASPHDFTRGICYQLADGRELGGTCTHWVRMTNFMNYVDFFPKVSVMYFILAYASV